VAAGVSGSGTFEDRTRAESFGAVAELYDRARPSYPPALIDALMADRPRTALDVGCGTGKAGALLLARGCEVLGVEVDARMAELARAKGLEVDVARFELWDPGERRFDLLISAQAWHWIEPRAGAVRAAAALREGGGIALFWNRGDPPEDVRERLDPIFDRLAPGLGSETAALERRGMVVHETLAGLESAGAFGSPAVTAFPWRRLCTTESWLELISTHSVYRTLEPQRRGRLLAALGEEVDALGGSFEMRYETVLVSARRVAAELA
jgi:SAM-dependent methyltransferase